MFSPVIFYPVVAALLLAMALQALRARARGQAIPLHPLVFESWWVLTLVVNQFAQEDGVRWTLFLILTAAYTAAEIRVFRGSEDGSGEDR